MKCKGCNKQIDANKIIRCSICQDEFCQKCIKKDIIWLCIDCNRGIK